MQRAIPLPNFAGAVTQKEATDMSVIDRMKRAYMALAAPHKPARMPLHPNETKLAKGDNKRVAHRLNRYRRFRAELEMDVWRNAIIRAEDPIRPRRLFLLELYKEVLRDYHLLSQVRNRIIKTTGSPYALFPVGGDEPDWELTRLFETGWFRKYMKYVLESIYYGHSLFEFQALKPARDSVPVAEEISDVVLIPRNHVVPEEGIVLINDWDESGLPFREAPWSEWLMEAGEPDDLGLLLPAVREVIWKIYSRTDWARASEKFSMPLLAMATAGMDDKEIDKMEEMAANFGSNGYVLLDDLDNMDMKESQKTDAYRIYLELCKYCDDMNSKGITGGTSLTDEKAFVGSAEVQERGANDIVEDDMRLVSTHVNEKLIPFLMGVNYPLSGYELRFISLHNADEDDSLNQGPQQKKN